MAIKKTKKTALSKKPAAPRKKRAASVEPVAQPAAYVMPEAPVRVERQAEPVPLGTQPSSAATITIQSWMTPIIALVMLVIGLLLGYYGRPLMRGGAQSLVQPGTTLNGAPPAAIPTADNSASQQQLMEAVIAQTRHFRGDPNAPVTMIEFGDFQCPFCGRFFIQTEPQVNQAYIESGKVRFGYVHFAFLGSESTWAAEASECASDQDKFWEYHDKLYGSQSGENQGAFSKDNLKNFAQELGLDSQAFNECLDSGKYASLVQQQTDFSSSINVRSTPTFLINGQAVIGAQPFEIFQQTIDALLK